MENIFERISSWLRVLLRCKLINFEMANVFYFYLDKEGNIVRKKKGKDGEC